MASCKPQGGVGGNAVGAIENTGKREASNAKLFGCTGDGSVVEVLAQHLAGAYGLRLMADSFGREFTSRADFTLKHLRVGDLV